MAKLTKEDVIKSSDCGDIPRCRFKQRSCLSILYNLPLLTDVVMDKSLNEVVIISYKFIYPD